MQPLKSLRDPAPSRSAYRLQRLWLTPGVRVFLRWGLPVACVALAAGIWASDADRRTALIEAAAELRRDVQERPEFMVKLLAVEGASPVVAEALRDELALELPISSFHLDLPEIRTRAEVAAMTTLAKAQGQEVSDKDAEELIKRAKQMEEEHR